MKYNPDIHHRRSIRLQHYDYSSEGCYFVTICCFNRLPLCKIAHNEWLNTINKRDNVELDEFVIMPNHIHCIIHITKKLNKSIDKKPTFQSPSNKRNYHEHIIRDEKSYNMIAKYVINNPMLWKNDCFYVPE